MFYLTLLFAAAALTAFVLCRALFHQESSDRVNFTECQEPRKYPHRGPLGIDLLYRTAKLMSTREIIPEFAAWHKTQGETFVVNSLGTPVVHTLSTENIKVIFETGLKTWGVAPARLEAMRPLCGAGFINSDGETWRRSRALIEPAFAESNTAELRPFALVVKDAMRRCPIDGSTFDISEVLDEIFLDASGYFLVGERLGILRSSGSEDGEGCPVSAWKFINALHATQFWIGIRVIFGTFASYVFKPVWTAHLRAVHQYIDYHIDRVLRQREKTDSDQKVDPNKGAEIHLSRSLLETLISQTDDRAEIRDHLVQAMITLQNKTSILVSNTLFLLARHPNIWQQLRQDTRHLSSTSCTALDLKKVVSLQNVFKEALRLYPVFGQLGRTAYQDTVLPSGGGPDGKAPMLARAGTRTLSSWYGLHRNASVFGDDVDDFVPDRWNSINPRPWEYMAFGNGPRNCVGQNKALVEASYLLLILLENAASIESRDTNTWAGEWKLTVKNFHGCKIALFPPE